MTGGELVARTLKGAGVGHVFTLCGGHILPIYDGCLGEAITLVDVRHEQAAAHCADAYARLTRRVGVAVVAPGPGVTDAVTGVANAYAARSPVLLIAGAAPQALRGLGALQEMDQIALVRSITKGAWTVAEPRQIPEVLTSAIRTALSGRPGPVFVEIPVDLLMATVEDRLAPIPRLSIHRPRPAADSDALAHLERLLAAAARPVVVAGGGVYWDDAAESLAAFAERAGAPVFMNGAGRGALPSSHPNAFALARGFALGQADLVLVLGTPLDFRLGYGRPPLFAEGAKVVMIDVDPGPLGCLGIGPSFALTAKLLHPERRVLLIAGDGALGLNGMELETAVRFGLPLTCVVGNDGGWGQIRNPQLSFYGEGRAVATSLPHTRFDLLAEALGGRGVLVREPAQIGGALARALASDQVWCVNVILDPEAYKKTGTVSMAI